MTNIIIKPKDTTTPVDTDPPIPQFPDAQPPPDAQVEHPVVAIPIIGIAIAAATGVAQGAGPGTDVVFSIAGQMQVCCKLCLSQSNCSSLIPWNCCCSCVTLGQMHTWSLLTIGGGQFNLMSGNGRSCKVQFNLQSGTGGMLGHVGQDCCSAHFKLHAA